PTWQAFHQNRTSRVRRLHFRGKRRRNPRSTSKNSRNMTERKGKRTWITTDRAESSFGGGGDDVYVTLLQTPIRIQNDVARGLSRSLSDSASQTIVSVQTAISNSQIAVGMKLPWTGLARRIRIKRLIHGLPRRLARTRNVQVGARLPEQRAA